MLTERVVAYILVNSQIVFKMLELKLRTFFMSETFFSLVRKSNFWLVQITVSLFVINEVAAMR